MSPEIWQDLATRLRNLRGDMLGQWQGDIDNRAIESTVTMLGNAVQTWGLARPASGGAAPQTPGLAADSGILDDSARSG